MVSDARVDARRDATASVTHAGATSITLDDGPPTGARATTSQVRFARFAWILLGYEVLVVAWGAYVAPTRDGIVFGATHDRDDAASDRRASDDARNRAALAARLPRLAARLEAGPVEARASVRATTPDRMPLAGQIAPGLFVLGGLGSRGFALAPLLAEHVAALALGAPSPLPAPLARIVGPDRFAERAARRLVGRAAPV